jgi:hypothetical protein
VDAGIRDACDDTEETSVSNDDREQQHHGQSDGYPAFHEPLPSTARSFRAFDSFDARTSRFEVNSG